MNSNRLKSERGQSLVIVALGLIAFVAMLALVLDGANAYAAKRQAQNAADAGALAGAQVMCKERSEENGEAAALTYAVLNGAEDYPVTTAEADLNSATVTVNAVVTKNTFFAGVIGFPQVSPKAVAVAACRPSGATVLPIAWSCRANVQGGPQEPGDVCAQKFISNCGGNPYDLGCTYVVMDSVKVKNKNDKNCKPDDLTCYTQNDLVCADPRPESDCVFTSDPNNPSTIDCDVDDDCIDELMTGGARSWLDLNGADNGACGGACELRRWLDGSDIPDPINVHTWLPEEGAVDTSIFHTAAAHVVGTDVVLPVFDKICRGYPSISGTETSEYCNAALPPDTLGLIDETNPSILNYHIFAFSVFHVTCVQTGRNKSSVTAEPGYIYYPANNKELCNGHWNAANKGLIDDNDKTIEGYFIRKLTGGYGGPGDFIDTGAFTVVLSK
jgi:hypothetical protein